MSGAPFPFVGAIAPFVVSIVVWWVTGSVFALLGAVVAPTMVIAHFLDARRRARAESRERAVRSLREDVARSEASARVERLRVIALAREFPSIADIVDSPDWTPPRDGATAIRAGHFSDGQPWIIDISAGVSVLGDGVAAEAVWATLTFHATARLGPSTVTAAGIRWGNGSRLVRGDGEPTTIAIRCSGNAVLTVTRIGQLPERGEWCPDSVRGIESLWSRLREIPRPELSVELSSETPHILVAGRTGSGKSVALESLVVDWCRRWSSNEFGFVGIDFKGGATLGPLARLPHHLATLTDLDVSSIPRALCGIAAEMRRRETVLAEQGLSGIDHANGLPRLAIVVDEVHAFLRQFPEAHDLFADVARRGRSLGVHLVLSVQHPTGVLRDGVLGNIAVRICLAMNTLHDITAVLGRSVTAMPSPHHALVTSGDGAVDEVRIRPISTQDVDAHPTGKGREPPWRRGLAPPIESDGRVGFGLIDDIQNAVYSAATWTPADGDVLVIGDKGAGRTTALRALTASREATWVQSVRDFSSLSGVVVIDDLDLILDSLSPVAANEFLDFLRRLRHRHRVAIATTSIPPRGVGSCRDVLTLRRTTMEEHRATGAPPETFDPAAAPGVGTWRGRRVVVYARTESTDTESIP